MTSPGPRDPTTLSDPRVDAAWRALSSEEPPKHLDAAIKAAARREARARPRRVGTLAGWAADRRWWPAAVAATVAVIAVGVLQLTTPEQLGAPAADNTVATDMPPLGAVPGTAAPPPRVAEVKSESRAGTSTERAAPRADAARRNESPAPAPAAKKPTPTPPPIAVGPEPFPAAPPPAPAVAPSVASGQQLAAPPPAPAVAPSVSSGEPAGPAPAPIPAAPAPPPRSAAIAAAQHAAEGGATAPAPLAKMAAGRAAGAAAGADEARAKDRAPLPVADWIVLIRRLRDEGKLSDAAKQLAAFRAAHADHARLLPPDLRDWRPPDR